MTGTYHLQQLVALVKMCHQYPLTFGDATVLGADKLAVFPHLVDLVQRQLILSQPQLLSKPFHSCRYSMTYWVQIARAEWSTVLEDLVQALLHRGEFISLLRETRSDITTEYSQTSVPLTIGINSSETGSLDDSKR